MSVRIVTASAGSGKTHKLVELTAEALLAGVRPEALVAVTYTRRAAEELVARLRTRLIAAGRGDLAGRLRDGHVGTVHAVCAALVRRHAFALGLSPTLVPMADRESRRLAREALEGVLLDASTGMEAAAARLSQDDWRATVERILALARVNGVGPEDLDRSARRSVDGYRSAMATGARADRWGRLQICLEAILPGLQNAADASATARSRCDETLAASRTLRRDGVLSWNQQLRLAKQLDLKGIRKAHPELLALLEQHGEATELFEDVEVFVTGVFRLAAKAFRALEERKRAARLLDFDDMLSLGLRLVEHPDIARDLAEELDFVVVDEFQDVSPLQLAVIGRLIALAGRGAWVGDEKQAIYSFQGSDPELVRAELRRLPEGTDPETLALSYRSRPALVRFCSDLFVAALARHGFPEGRVRLEPARVDHPSLQAVPALLCWRWPMEGRVAPNGDREIASEAHAAAAGVRRLLDEGVPVTAKDGSVRGALPQDVAVLCRTNAQVARMALALRARGLPAVIRSPGLLGTEEAQLVRAAVALVLDPADGVAAATIAWLADLIVEPDAWLGGRLAQVSTWQVRSDAASIADQPAPPCPPAFDDLAPIRALRDPNAGLTRLLPSALVPRIAELLDLPRWCEHTADPSAHLGNLDALVALADDYEAACAARRAPWSLPGFLESLRRIDEEEDGGQQAVTTRADAVTVTTWHASKGLEWPVVVLTALDDAERGDVFGLHIEGPAELDATHPLEGRWLRLWPWPYGAHGQNVPIGEGAGSTAEAVRVRDREERERARLLYVGFTRARDRLILSTAVRKGELATRWLDTLLTVDGEPALEFGEGVVRAGGVEHRCPIEDVDPWPAPAQEDVQRERTTWPPGRPVAHPPAVLRPSGLDVVGPVGVGQVLTLGPARAVRMAIGAQRGLGDALHRFLASDALELGTKAREERAGGWLRRHGVSGPGLDAAFVEMADALWNGLDAQWPDATWMREWPVWRALPNGQRMQGEVDLLGELADGLIVVDHKAYAGSDEGKEALVGRYAGQVGAYVELCERAFGKPVIGAWLHLPLPGELVEVRRS